MQAKNVGTTDRIIRVIAGILVALGGYKLGGYLSIPLYIIAALAIITGIRGRCHAYEHLGINTCRVKK